VQRRRVGPSFRSPPYAKAFDAALPHARVVRIPQANHFVFMSHEADVLSEMESFR
jgi:hypothetical protein